MKKYSLLLCAMLLVLSVATCKKADTEPVIEVPNVQGDTLLRQGTLQNEVHSTVGMVKIYQQATAQLLVLENFRTDNGPALYVYLSRDKSVSNSLNLGKLKSSSGTFSYPIDDSVSIEDYPYVLIWCREFAVLFGSSQLQKP